MQLLVTPDVPSNAYRSLAAAGWQVLPVRAVSNPGKWMPHGSQASSKFPSQFRSVYTKLHVFNMTQYSRGDLLFDPAVPHASSRSLASTESLQSCLL